MKTLAQLMQESAQLKAILKERSHIYQVDAKEEAARAFRRPLNYFYHWPYRHWRKVSRMLEAKHERVAAECVSMGMPETMPYNQFPHYRKEMGL